MDIECALRRVYMYANMTVCHPSSDCYCLVACEQLILHGKPCSVEMNSTQRSRECDKNDILLA